MAYSVIRSWRQAIKDCSHGFVISVWFYISEGMVIAGQMPKCYSFSGSGCPFLLSAMSLGVRFENVFSTVWFVFFPLTFIFFLTQHINITSREATTEGAPPLFVSESFLWVPHTHTHTHTPCNFLPRLTPDSSLPVSQTSIFASPEPWLNTMSTCIIQYVSNGVCVSAVAQPWVELNVDI